MANLIRSAKSGSDWVENNLYAFNIRVVTVNATVFFGNPDLPQAPVSQVILQNERLPDEPLSRDDRLFFEYLDDAETSPEESAVDDFAVLLLRTLNYEGAGHRRIRTRKDIQFLMCGTRVSAKTDVCIMDRDQYLLVVREDKRRSSIDNPEPQLVAECIAAAYHNNLRRSLAGFAEQELQMIPGITMVGATPTFYRVPVSTALTRAIQLGDWPKEESIVFRFVPPVPHPQNYVNAGMRPLENRRIVLQCFEAFKAML